MFMGTYYNSIDSKNRLIVPSKHRDQLRGWMLAYTFIPWRNGTDLQKKFLNFLNPTLRLEDISEIIMQMQPNVSLTSREES